MKLAIGELYSHKEIREALGGGEPQIYLPQKDGKIIAGLFKRERNPEVPNEIQVGKGVQNVKKAELLAEQDDKRIPVFIKSTDLKDTNKPWQYYGEYQFSELLSDTRILKEAEEKSGRHGELTYVLRLEPVLG